MLTWRVVIIKRLSFLLIIVMLASILAGCTKPVDTSEASPFSVYDIKGSTRYSIGDKRENIEKSFAGERTITVEFEEADEYQVFEQVSYHEVGIAFDYDRAGNVLGVQSKSNKWKIENGLKVTDSVEDVKRKYSDEYLHTYPVGEDLYYALDENGSLIAFSESAPYILRFEIEQYAISRIIIKKNVQ